jgi:hypothetical protein
VFRRLLPVLIVVAFAGVCACVAVRFFPGRETPPPAVKALAVPMVGTDGSQVPSDPRLRLRIDEVVKNRSGTDGSGLNVPACVETMANRQGLTSFHGLTEFAASEAGGYYPGKLDHLVKRFASPKRLYSQKMPRGDAVKVIEKRLAAGLPVAVSDHGGPHSRYAVTVSTFVVVLQLDPEQVNGNAANEPQACLWDPNWPNEYEWVRRDRFVRRITPGKESTAFAWVVYLTND